MDKHIARIKQAAGQLAAQIPNAVAPLRTLTEQRHRELRADGYFEGVDDGHCAGYRLGLDHGAREGYLDGLRDRSD